MRSEAGAEITTENIHLKLSHRRIVYELLIVVTNHIPHDCVFGLSCCSSVILLYVFIEPAILLRYHVIRQLSRACSAHE